MNNTHPRPHLKNLSPYLAKKAFRGFLLLFAAWWRDARDSAPEDSLNAAVWPGYYSLLRVCQDILDRAPMHPNEAKTVNIHRRYERSLERLATTLAHLFPTSFMDLESYVQTAEVTEWKRTRGLARYRRIKGRRKRYKKGRGRK